MKQSLKDLKKDDWNKLFPIELVDHKPEWKEIYDAEKHLIIGVVGKERILRIEHFGSTSITSIKSKPYVDIIAEIPPNLLFDDELIEDFSKIGYSHFKVPARGDVEEYSTFGKGYHIDGRKDQIFHIHLCPKENKMWRQIEFRDYLIRCDKRAKEYESLKLELASKFKNDRGAYVLGKTAFINETIHLANQL